MGFALRVCWELLGAAGNYWELICFVVLLRVAGSCLDLLRDSGNCLELLGVAWSFVGNGWGLWELLRVAGLGVCDELLGVIGNWELLGIVWTCLELLGIAGSCSELPGIAQSCWEFARTCWELLGVAGSC